MSLTTEVTDRYSLQVLLGVTNPDDTSAVTNGTTKLAAAIVDAQGDFPLIAQVDFDQTDAMHLRIFVERVVGILWSRMNREGGDKRLADTKAMLEQLASVSSRGRILPQTSSVVVPTDESLWGRTVRPDFDRSRFRDFVPEGPPAIDPWNS